MRRGLAYEPGLLGHSRHFDESGVIHSGYSGRGQFGGLAVIRQLDVTRMARHFEKQLVLRCILNVNNLNIERLCPTQPGQTRH